MNQMNPAFVMPDVQSTVDTRQIPIQRVGVRGVRHPLTVRLTGGDTQATVGMFNLDVHLPADQKGTHMSRFVALLEENHVPMDVAGFRAMLDGMLLPSTVSLSSSRATMLSASSLQTTDICMPIAIASFISPVIISANAIRPS